MSTLERDSHSHVEFEHTTCPLCRSARAMTYRYLSDLLYGFPGRFRIVRCLACRHLYLNPRPTRETIMAFYPDEYGAHQVDNAGVAEAGRDLPGHGPGDNAAHSRPQPWYLSRPVRSIPGLPTLYRWLADTDSTIIPETSEPQPRGLELGCGTGSFALQLRQCGWDVVGVELSPRAAAIARRRGVPVHVGTLESLGLPAESFDAVFAWMVVEHLHDPVGTLDAVHRILKPGGLFAFSVPNCGAWESRIFGRYWYAWQVPTHLQHFTPATLHALLRRTNFRCERFIHQANCLNWIGSLGLWLREGFPRSAWGDRLLQFTNAPTMWPQLALAPLAKLTAAVGQSGRVTVVARRAD